MNALLPWGWGSGGVWAGRGWLSTVLEPLTKPAVHSAPHVPCSCTRCPSATVLVFGMVIQRTSLYLVVVEWWLYVVWCGRGVGACVCLAVFAAAVLVGTGGRVEWTCLAWRWR